MTLRLRLLVVAGLLIAAAPSCSEAGAAVGVVRQARNQPYAALIVPMGDSIVYGVNAETRAGWREFVYNYAAATTSRKVYFTGTQSFAGNASGLAADPLNEGRPNWVVKAGAAQVPPSSFNSLTDIASLAVNRGSTIVVFNAGTNDIASNVLNDTAANTITSISTWMDAAWSYRTTPRFQIVLCELLRRLDADNTKVIEVNAGLPAVIASKAYASNVTLIAMYDAITRAVVGQGYNDVVHPNDEGYGDMAARLWTGGLQVAIDRSAGR